MSLFAWANRQLEQLTDKLAPVPSDPAHRFSKACSSNDGSYALQLLSSMPPPLPDGTQSSPLDPFSTIIHKQRGSLAIHCAAEYAQVQVVQALIAQYGVPAEQFDQQGNTPLHYAASSVYPQALALVKMLVQEYNVSATVKNMYGQTPYDMAKNDSIRQYLLPIQLQSETQKCIDEGGKGLPEGTDLGGLVIQRDLPPPPVVAGFGSPPMMGNSTGGGPVGGTQPFSAAGMTSASKYAVPDYGLGGSSQYSYAGNVTYPPVGAAHSSYHSPMMQNKNDQGAYPSNGFVTSPPTVSSNVTASVPTNASLPPNSDAVTGETKATAAAVTGETKATAASTASGTGTNSEEMKIAKSTLNIILSAQGQNVTAAPEVAHTVTSQVPAANGDANALNVPMSKVPDASATATYASAPSPMRPTVASTTSQDVAPANVTAVKQIEGEDSAPSSGSGYARRGYSSAAVLPTNAKYKPDGFHSSSSDVSLQKKYGHDPSITGPPSGTFRISTIAPPPSTSTAVTTPGSNPFAARSTYGVSPAMARPRYPTYDAISDTVGAAPGGIAAYNYNPYATPHIPGGMQYNVYNPTNQYHLQSTYHGNQYQNADSLSPWKTATAPDGRIYYYNEITNETTWDMPTAMIPQQTKPEEKSSTLNDPNADLSNEDSSVTNTEGQAFAKMSEFDRTKNDKDSSEPVLGASTPTDEFFNLSISDPVEGKANDSNDIEPEKLTGELPNLRTENSDPNVETAVFGEKNDTVSDSILHKSAASATEFFGSLPNSSMVNESLTSSSTVHLSCEDKKGLGEVTSDGGALINAVESFVSSSQCIVGVSREDEIAFSKSDEFLSPPPFTVDECNDVDDTYLDEDLPPPPMIDISLS